MNAKNLTITWTPDLGGRPALVASDDCGDDQYIVEHEEPINAGTDSHAIVGLFAFAADVVSVDHDGEYIHVGLAE